MTGKAKHFPLSCSFCFKSQHDVLTLIAGPNLVFICDECIRSCNNIIFEFARENLKIKKDSVDKNVTT